jgi:hypothetical protein
MTPDLILLTETWCNEQILNAFLDIPGYELLQDLRKDRRIPTEVEEADF